jgi:hypothetical protein
MKSSSFRRVVQSGRAQRLTAYTLSVRHLLHVDDGRFRPRDGTIYLSKFLY